MANRMGYVQQAQNIFWQFDLNRNGTLSKKEFKIACTMHFGIPSHQAKFLFRMMDRDGNGVITLDEFINAYLFIMAGGASYIVPMPSRRMMGMGMMGMPPMGMGMMPPQPMMGVPPQPFGYQPMMGVPPPMGMPPQPFGYPPQFN